MNLRGQILIGAILMAVLPLALAIRLIGSSVEDRFTALDIGRVTNQLALARDDLDRQSQAVSTRLDALHAAGKRTVIWGSGSKGVSFLTTLGLTDEIAGAVDINPHRQGYFMPGTGHQIYGPDDLVEMKPDAVIVMNPIYKDEIAADLEKRGLHPEIFAVDDGLETLKKS